MLNHFILGRWGIVSDIIDAVRPIEAGEDGRYDVVDMDAAKYLAGQVYAVCPPLPHTVQRAAARPINTGKAEYGDSRAQHLPFRISSRPCTAPATAYGRAFIDPRAAGVSVYARGGEIARPPS